MTTAEKINNFSDAGKFQILVDSILRFSNIEYESIISTGVNTEEKTIKSPLDGFTQIPGSQPPKFVMVQHTTAKLEELEIKWLFDHTTATGKRKEEGHDGDVVKAGRFAQEIRQKISDAEFVLILTTNRPLSLNKQKGLDPLIPKTYQKCQEFNIQCEIWEQSRITHFLDNTPDGHWLRKKYLGIDAELLSEKLLETICKINLQRYKQSLFLGDDDLLQTEMETTVEREINTQNQGLHLLIGESGFGKSTISYHILKKHIESGGFGLWISVDDIDESLPLENIICKILKKLYTNIRIDSETDIWRFATKQQFFIIIDDLNRASDPNRMLQRIISFLPPKSIKSEEPVIKIPFTLISPVWPKYWAPISREFQNNPQIHQTQINKFTLDESESIIINAFQKSDTQITRLQANQIAKNLGCDPLLIGLFVKILRRDDIQISLLSKDVIDIFIQRNLEKIAQKSISHFQSSEYNEVLLKICTEILIQKQFFPTFIQIEDWLRENPKYIHIFRDLVTDRILCSIDNEKLVFRHDRIQFYLLTQSMVKILESDDATRSNVISDPYYAEILGQSILLKDQSLDRLTKIQTYNILALFEALKLFGEPKRDYEKTIIGLILASNDEIFKNKDRFPSLLDAICWQLVYTDSDEVIKMSEHLSNFRLIRFARIRNGCVKSGIDFCSNFNHFEPSSNFPFRDRIFEHAIEKHSTRIHDDLKNILESTQTTDKDRYGALIFTGLLGLQNLRNEILICWNNSQDKKTVLPAAIWAGINCCEEDPDEILNPIFEYWAKISNVRDGGNLSELEQIADQLRLALMIKRKLSNSIVKFCILQSKIHESFDWAIKDLLYVIDDPDALEFVVRNSSEYLGMSFMRDVWDYRRQVYGQKLSRSSLNRLESIWKTDEENETCRKNALSLWKTSVESDDLVKIQKILPNSPLFTNAVILRTELKDLSVIPDYLKLLSENYRFLDLAHYLWSEEIQKNVENILESSKNSISKDFKGGCQDNNYALAKLLMAIPPEDAEKLLLKNWDTLGFSRDYINAALYIGTPELLKLAEIAIKKCPPEIDIFEHFTFIFWFTDYNGGQSNLTIARLNNLKPYLNRFSKESAESLAHICNSCGFTDWGRIHLSGLLSDDDRRHLYPSDDDIIEFFKDVTKREGGLSDIQHIWLKKFEEDKVSKERLFKILEKMLVNDPSYETFQIVSICVKMKGNRKDLELLNKYTIRGSGDKISDIKKDVQFQVFRRTLE